MQYPASSGGGCSAQLLQLHSRTRVPIMDIAGLHQNQPFRESCRHQEKCQYLKEVLQREPPACKWIFIRLESTSAVEVNEVADYLQMHTRMEDPRVCIGAYHRPGSNAFCVLLAAPSDLYSQDLCVRLQSNAGKPRGSALGEQLTSVGLLSDCLDSYELNAPFWSSYFKVYTILSGEKLLCEFRDAVARILEKTCSSEEYRSWVKLFNRNYMH